MEEVFGKPQDITELRRAGVDDPATPALDAAVAAAGSAAVKRIAEEIDRQILGEPSVGAAIDAEPVLPSPETMRKNLEETGFATEGPPPGTPELASGTGDPEEADTLDGVDVEAGCDPSDSRLLSLQQMQALHDRVDSDFTYHRPVGVQPNVYYEIRERSRALAHFLIDHVPPGRELSRALSDLEDMVMHANAGVARNPESYI
jgi:hypothetical protein